MQSTLASKLIIGIRSLYLYAVLFLLIFIPQVPGYITTQNRFLCFQRKIDQQLRSAVRCQQWPPTSVHSARNALRRCEALPFVIYWFTGSRIHHQRIKSSNKQKIDLWRTGWSISTRSRSRPRRCSRPTTPSRRWPSSTSPAPPAPLGCMTAVLGTSSWFASARR